MLFQTPPLLKSCSRLGGHRQGTKDVRSGPWEYVRHLIPKGYIGVQAIQIVQSKRDPETHGIGLRRVAA